MKTVFLKLRYLLDIFEIVCETENSFSKTVFNKLISKLCLQEGTGHATVFGKICSIFVTFRIFFPIRFSTYLRIQLLQKRC